MKRTFYVAEVLATSVLMIGCNNRQPAQTVAQQSTQPPTAQQPVTQQPAASPQPENPQPVAPPVAEQPQESGTQPQASPTSPRYERVPDQRASRAREAEATSARREISIPAGTTFDVRLEETIDTKRNRPGDRFDATLTRSIVLDGQTVIPRGAHCTGHLVQSQSSGRLKGHAELMLSLDSFEVNGRRHEIITTRVARASGGHKKRNWVAIGGGSGLGSAIGAIAGGPVGAVIGAGAGAGAGTAGAVITGKKNVHLPVETLLAFTLREPVVLAN